MRERRHFADGAGRLAASRADHLRSVTGAKAFGWGAAAQGWATWAWAVLALAMWGWQDPSLAPRGNEAPITLRYAEKKKTLSRETKLRCHAAFTILRDSSITAWEDVNESR